MTDAQLYTNFYLSLGVAVVVILIAAGLLIAILLVARSIEKGATAALGMVGEIRDNTKVIWALQDTNEVAAQLRDGASAILTNAGAIAQALHEGELRRGDE
jgi:hypothetical protein